jgi:hypothetical protein
VLTPTIRAAAIGHDLTFGTTMLARAPRRTDPPADEQPAPDEPPAAPPVDRSGEWAAPMSDGGTDEVYLPDDEPAWSSAG